MNQLTSFQDSLRNRLEEMGQTIGNIAGELHVLKERMEVQTEQQASPPPVERFEPGKPLNPAEPATSIKGWMKRFMVKVS